MRRIIATAVGGLVLVVGAVTFAQQPASPPGPMPHQMQGGMCPMMGGMMGGGMTGSGMMGMMGAQSDSPRMVHMRGEMMKAMGEVMVKYGKMMEGEKK